MVPHSALAFWLEPGEEYLIKARIAVGDERQCDWNAGTHIRMAIETAAGGHCTNVWVPLSNIIPWPTIESFGLPSVDPPAEAA